MASRDRIRTFEFTRPANTTAYAVGDSVSDSTSAPTVVTFTSVTRVNGGGGMLKKVRIVKSDSGVTNASFRLHFFVGASPPSAINDNTAFALLYSNRNKRFGSVDLVMLSEGSGSDSAEDVVLPDIPFDVDASNNNVYAILTAQGAWTPTSAEKFFIEITVEPR